MSLADDDLHQLSSLLTTVQLGRTHEHHAVLRSTNDRAQELLDYGAPDGTLVTADEQTAGRGRLGRTWSSPPGRDLYASVILRPGVRPATFGAVALAVAVGLRDGLVSSYGESMRSLALKWPNDLWLGGRKLGGILCECRWRGREAELVIGFGINVHRKQDEFELELQERATSLAMHLAPAARRGRAAILAAVLAELERTLEQFFEGGFAAIRPRYEPHCLVIGATIDVEEPSGRRFMAIAEGLDPDGALRVRPRDGGPSVRVESADVWLSESP